MRSTRGIVRHPRLRRLITGVAVALALAGAPAAWAEVLHYDLPMALASAYTASGADVQMDAEYMSLPTGDKPRFAVAGAGGASARACASSNFFQAMATQSGAGAFGQAYMYFVVGDPEDRENVKVKFKYKAAASTGSGLGSANFTLRIGYPTGDEWSVRTRPDGTIESVKVPAFEYPRVLEVTGTHLKNHINPGGSGVVYVVLNGQILDHRVGSGPASDGRTIELGVRPGRMYMMAVIVGTAAGTTDNSGVAVVDPIVEPHEDNPNVVVNLYQAAVDPIPRPPMGDLTPEELEAEGIDVTPLLELGFFDPPPPPPPPPAPGDSTAPTTSATPSPGPNVNGWNSGPVTVTLAASDDANGSGVKEVHYSLAGASDGSQVVAGDNANVAISAEGTTTVTYFAVDNAGNEEAAQTLTVRIDTSAPTLAGLPPAGCRLWPPNHRLVQVASVTAGDPGSGLTGAPLVTATSNEPANGTGDGDMAPDIFITGGVVQLRAERAGNGAGREYEITATASDLALNSATATAICRVPHH